MKDYGGTRSNEQVEVGPYCRLRRTTHLWWGMIAKRHRKNHVHNRFAHAELLTSVVIAKMCILVFDLKWQHYEGHIDDNGYTRTRTKSSKDLVNR